MIEEKVFLSKDYSEGYPFLRKMDLTTFEQYRKLIINKIDPNKQPIKILDIGCGTGNFSILFATTLGEKDCLIHAIDKSPQMLKIAAKQVHEENLTNITLFECDVENILEVCGGEKYDIIFSSEMIHLVKDIKIFFSNVSQLLSEKGIFAIRTSTHEQLYERDWYKYFKGTLTIDLERHKSKYLIKSTLEDLGFRNEIHTIDESEYVNRDHYFNMFKNKCYSTLRLIPEIEFNNSLQIFEKSLNFSEKVYRNYEMTLYLSTNYEE